MSEREQKSRISTNIVAAYARGDDVLVDPMDFVLLDSLPPEGTMFAGAYPDGPSSIDLAANLFEGLIGAGQIAGRLRVLRLLGFAVTANRRGRSDKVWQITAKGEALLNEWKERRETNP